MIIDKVAEFWTLEDRQRLLEINQRMDAVLDEIQAAHARGERARVDEWHKLSDEENELRREVESRYIKARSKKEILADAEEIVAGLTKDEYLADIAVTLDRIAGLRERGTDEAKLAALKAFAKENYENCFQFILWFLRVQLNALADDEAGTERIKAIVDKRVSLWYVKTTPAFMPMVHGRATDALAFMNSRNAEIDPVTGTGTLDKLGVELTIMKLRNLKATLNPNTDKLLSTALATFTQHNDFRHLNGKEPNRRVSIPLKDYAQLLGYEVDERETSTPQEAEREKKRAKNQLDNARKAVKKDLNIIHASTLAWEEPIKGKSRDFARVSLVTYTGIVNGEIQIAFSPEIAGYLAERNLITQYPTKLLSLDSRKTTAYYVARKLYEHYHIDNNQIRGTADRISIPALLAVTDLASYEEVQKKDRGHWQERIKEPLERALDELTGAQILRDWKYTHAKGVDLTKEEAYSINSYSDYEKLFLHFTLEDTVDHTERIKAKQEAAGKKRYKRKKEEQGRGQ